MNNPLNVVINAMEIPSEILSIFPVAIMLNVFIIPITVLIIPMMEIHLLNNSKSFCYFLTLKQNKTKCN